MSTTHLNISDRFSLTIFFLMMVLFAGHAQAQVNPAIVRTDPAILEMTAGEVYEVSIMLENAFEVYGIDVRMRFNPDVIEVIDADSSRDGIQVQQGDIPQPDFAALYVADNEAGEISYVVIQTNPTPPASGSGTIFKIQLRAKTEGQSLLAFDLVEMSNLDGFLLDVTTEGSQLVTDEGGSNVTPGAAIPLASATTGSNSGSAATSMPESGAVAATSIVASTANNGSSDPEPTTASSGQRATATHSPPSSAANALGATQPADNGDVEQSETPFAEGAVGESTESSPEATPLAVGKGENESPAATVQTEVGQASPPAGEIIAQIEPVQDEAQAVAPVKIGSEVVDVGGENAGSIGETAVSEQTNGSETTYLFVLALIMLALVVIGLVIVISRRRFLSS